MLYEPLLCGVIFMTESDEKYYKRKEVQEEKHRKALNKAQQRGEYAKAWFDAGNKLTSKTKPLFDALMKESDKQWDDVNAT